MGKDDYILYVINRIKQLNPLIPQEGYFESETDKTYRLEAIRRIFCGLERENQDEILRYAMEKLLGQNPKLAEQARCIEGGNMICLN